MPPPPRARPALRTAVITSCVIHSGRGPSDEHRSRERGNNLCTQLVGRNRQSKLPRAALLAAGIKRAFSTRSENEGAISSAFL